MPGIERALDMAVCHLGNDDSEVLPMRTGSDSVGASAVGREESVSNAALGHHKFIACIGAHRCLVLLSLAGEAVGTLEILGFVNHYFSF